MECLASNTYTLFFCQTRIFIALAIEAVFFAIVVFVNMFFFHTTKDRTLIVGIICIIFNILMYASPLTVMVCTNAFDYANKLIWMWCV